jgi:selenide,water dikinase
MHRQKLTELSSGAGCGCKLSAAAILPIVRSLPICVDERLLVGSATSDDAAVFQIRDDLALVQTVDFFTPVVDDPYDFGRIAATNALSDVYAMGGQPVTAMNIVAFPLRHLGDDVLREVLRGGFDVVHDAGALVVGGHSIEDREPKYGLAVTGIIDPSKVISNAAAVAGDTLVLTKPLGSGAVVTAHQRGGASTGMLQAAVSNMVTLNDLAAQAAVCAGAHAMTDVTGFGLLGHLHHICRESQLAAELDARDIPMIDGVKALLESEGCVSGGSRRNSEWAASFTTIEPGVAPWQTRLLTDATTSGGLLVALPPAVASQVPGTVVGRLVEGRAGTIRVR